MGSSSPALKIQSDTQSHRPCPPANRPKRTTETGFLFFLPAVLWTRWTCILHPQRSTKTHRRSIIILLGRLILGGVIHCPRSPPRTILQLSGRFLRNRSHNSQAVRGQSGPRASSSKPKQLKPDDDHDQSTHFPRFERKTSNCH